MPERSEGKYRLYIGGSDIFNKDFENGTNSHFVGVCDLAAEKRNSICVYARLNNTDTVQRSAGIVVAQYRDKALNDVKTEKVTVAANNVLGGAYNFAVPLAAGTTEVKVFVLDSLNNLTPLSEWIYAE